MVIGFKFDDIDKMVYQLKGLEYDDRFLTASFSLSALMPDSYIFGFRIFNDTSVDDIASQIIDIIKEYAFPIFDSADTLDKYKEKLISKDDTFVKGSNSSNGTEWNLLAIAVLYNNELIQTILKDYNKNFNLREQFFFKRKTRTS